VAAPLHLVRRFLGSLSTRPLDPADARWAHAQLLAGERELWDRMSRADRKHAAGVAREVARRLGDDATRPVLAAALLHDVGKVQSGLGTAGRVLATLVGRRRAGRWAGRRGLAGRIERYRRHDELGADTLAAAGSDPVTVAWAREHHLPPSAWSVPPTIGRALRDADDD
jgi:hypothetical protein